MSFTFRPALRENVGLLVGLAGGTGSGKTYSAMRLASGIAGADRFAVIDTEAGRAKHYADRFSFDHGDLKPPFTPERYTEAIIAADEAGYPVVVVDSVSHEHAGDGGLLDMQEAEFARMGHKEAARMASWIKPKMAHKAMLAKLLQVRAHLILCFRAEEKIEMQKGPDGRMIVVPKQSRTGLAGWIPVCEKNLPYELTASFLLLADQPGVPRPIKLQEQHRDLFPPGEPITEQCGRRLSAWARGAINGGVAQSVEHRPLKPSVAGSIPAALAQSTARTPEATSQGTGDVATSSLATSAAVPLEERPPPGKPIMFTTPGAKAVRLGSVEEWLSKWADLAGQVAASRADAGRKEAKLRELWTANQGNVRAMGARMVARMQADVADRVKGFQAVAHLPPEGNPNEPDTKGADRVSAESKDGG